MDKRKWLWKRKPSEKSPGETESSGSISSHSERYSDDQEGSKASPNHSTQSPEVTSKATASGDEIDDSVKILTDKLSAALINVSAKEDLVKQHAKVAEEAVEGWEKAENEVALLKQQLEAAVQKNLALEDRANHLDGALKECVRQLRQGREEQEQKILGAVLEKTHEWEFIKVELETQLECLERENSALKQTETKSPTSIDPDLLVKLEFLERENSTLKLELLSRSEELEIRTIERDLSAQAAETASKQHLESIKKVAKLEAECRRLQVLARKFPPDQKSVSVSSICVESLTDSQSDSGEKLNALEMDFPRTSRSNLTTEVDQLKNENVLRRSITGSSLEIDMMDDFLEMERLAALPESETKNKMQYLELDNGENQFKNDFEAKDRRIIELEEKIKKIEAEKAELEEAVATSRSSYEESQFQLKDAEMRLEDIKKELAEVNESRKLLEFQLTGMEVETRTMSSKVDTLMEEIKKEQSLSAEMAIQCQELQNELAKKSQEIELQQAVIPKLEQEELNVAAGKLAECQKTIASLGRQLQSLATLEDFLIDTANLPGFSGENELWKLHSNETCMLKNNSELKELVENSGPSLDGNDENSQASSSASLSHICGTKSRNGFGKFFTRSKSGIQLENQQS